MMATGRGDVQQLKDLRNKEDATMSSGSKDSLGDPTPASINPLLLASACFGSTDALTFLFNREDAQELPMMMPTQEFLDLLVGYKPGSSNEGRLAVLKQPSDDVEMGVDQPALHPAGPLLKGVNPEGDTALHAVASHGNSPEFLECANIIYKRANGLLFEPNKKGDTPLHCAARAGNSEMVSRLIELARSGNRLDELLRKENVLKEKGLKETALHDAVRIGNEDIVDRLMTADSGLANYPKDGISPLYLAIFLGNNTIARKLYTKSKGNLSYSGLDGQNALHIAILQNIVMIETLLDWNKNLTTQGDRNGSTPLHFASSVSWTALCLRLHRNPPCIRFLRLPIIPMRVFEANPAAVYQADNKGLFPIHVAASVGAERTIRFLLEKCPSSAGLRDAKGRTFLHVAIEKRRLKVASFVCRTQSLAWILNKQDNDGNTALHLAVQAGKLGLFCCLFGNPNVHLSLANSNGKTPLDLSRSKLPPGMYYNVNSESQIFRALRCVGAKHSGLRWDHIHEQYNRHLKQEQENKESEKVKDSTQTLCIGSVLIATVTFGATFALPGGYRGDDHTNGGTPTLARKHTFDAFIMANTFAFICSSIATIGLMYSGSPMVNLGCRQFYLGASVYFMQTSITSLTTAFALGAYVVLAPVAHKTAIALCVLSSLVVLFRKMEFWLKWALLAPRYRMRLGLIWILRNFVLVIVKNMIFEFWPLIFIFIWVTSRK